MARTFRHRDSNPVLCDSIGFLTRAVDHSQTIESAETLLGF